MTASLALVTPFLLFAGAALGHLALMITSHNWWYGLPLSKRMGDVAHNIHALLTLAFPAALYFLFGWDLAAVFDLGSGPAWQLPLALYVGLCLVTAVVALPAITVLRLVRREPFAECRSEVLDVAAVLGTRPVGDNKQRALTFLPGNQVFQVEFV